MRELLDSVDRPLKFGSGHVRVVTAGDGQPAVLFDAALGMPLEEWSLVAPAVARFTSVTLWDRPGIGQSSSAPPLGGHEVSDALAAVATDVGADGVIGVGHSRGGLNMLCFAFGHPELVRGLVLVEPSYPDYERHMRASGEDPLIRAARTLARLPSWLPTGAAKVARGVVSTTGGLLGPGPRLMAEMALLVAARIGGVAAEIDARGVLVTECEQLMRTRQFPNIPTVVITGTRNFANAPVEAAEWEGMHAELAGLSSLGEHWRVECGHDVPFSRPDSVIDAIRRVYDRVAH